MIAFHSGTATDVPVGFMGFDTDPVYQYGGMEQTGLMLWKYSVRGLENGSMTI